LSDLLVTSKRFHGFVHAPATGQHQVGLRNPQRRVAPLPELRLDGRPVLAEGFLPVRGHRGEPEQSPFAAHAPKLLPNTRRVIGTAEKRVTGYNAPVAIGEAHQTLPGVLAGR
jgi:hypothetical protein